MATRSNRLMPKGRFRTPKRKLPRYGAKGSPLVTRSLTGPLKPVPSHAKRPCMPSKGKGIEKGTCRSELVFMDGGVRLRLCSDKGQPGPVVPVSSPAEATRVSREFCACVKRKDAKACVSRVGRGAPLGAYRGR